MGAQQQAEGPDFALGVAIADIADGATLPGRVGDEPVLVSRRGGEFFAVSSGCTHYGGPLGEGLVTGDQVRCPWHHACFSLRTGEALAAPAFAPLARWRAVVEDDKIFLREKIAEAAPAPSRTTTHPKRIVIIGGGAAGFAAAEMLRRRGFAGELTMVSADASAPYDRPNLSKDYLAGTAPEDWIPLKDEAFYRDHRIDLRLGAEAAALDVRARKIKLSTGRALTYDALLLATGAAPMRPQAPGFDRANVHVLRSLADSRAIIAAAASAQRVAIVGAGFIGLETAASLRARGLETDVIAPDVRVQVGRTAERFDGRRLRLSDGADIEADFVIIGVGVRPNVELAEKAGLKVDAGIVVDAQLRTSAPGVFAAGDVARYPDARLGQPIRIEHWVAATRQGQDAALNMLGETAPHLDAPFFWSHHYESSIRYVGHAPAWDRIEVEGSIDAGDFTVRYLSGAKLLAAASLRRDSDSVAIHEQMNKEAQASIG
jgi:NADPH-dependent 2,4-dienoyl-CoA reductase/sulfur reductase-like enzyme/nitrite reductase/ring-hydroxylating ferredoxin subunit